MGLPPLQMPKIAGPMDNLSQAMQLKNMMQQGQMQQQSIQTGQLDLQEKQQQLADQKAMTAAMHEWDGKEIDQLPSLILKNGGSSTAVMGMKSKVLEQKKTYAQIAKDDAETGKNQTETALKRNDILLGQLNTVTDGQSLLQVAQNAANQGLLDPQHLQIAQSWSQLPPDQLKAHLDIFKKSLQSDSEQRKAAMEEVDANLKRAQTPGAEAKSQQEVRANGASQLVAAFQNGGVQGYVKTRMGMPYSIAKDFPDMPKSADEILQPGMTPHEQATIPVEKMELKDYMAKNPGKGPADFARFKASIAPTVRFNLETGSGTPPKTQDGQSDWDAVAKRLGTTKAQLTQSAENYFQTGKMPALGRGQSGIAENRAIRTLAAELHPEGDLAGNVAAFNANKASLSKLQTNFDQVSAFESTAKKNIDLLEQTAKQIPDLGLRFANTPVRALSANMIGTEQMAAFKTALNTAQTEAAKVLNSSNASGVLSDSARHELQDIVDGNLSYKAMVASLNTLRQDMSNRHQSYQEQISDIQGRLKTKGSAPQGGSNTQPQGGGNDPFSQFGGVKH